MSSNPVITDQDLPPEVLQAILDGRKVEAISRLREITGMGLANAKVVVDAAARRHGVQREYPAMTDSKPSPMGLIKLLLLAVTAYIAYQYFVA